jgi:hypothetical protein
MTLPARAAFVVLALASVSACTKAQARTPGPTPALETPAPPPRMVVPAPPLEPVPPPEPAATSSAPVGPVRSTQPPNRAPERTSPPAATPTTSPATPDPPAPVLQTQQNVGELEQQTRVFLDQAQKSLAKVDARTLGRDARDQFNLAQRYIDLSKQQMDLKNFVRARVLAENAAALAGQLVK